MAKPTEITVDELMSSMDAIDHISAEDFLKSLAEKSRSSKVELMARLARKNKERKKCLDRMRKLRFTIRQYTIKLKTDEDTYNTLEADVASLRAAIKKAKDD